MANYDQQIQKLRTLNTQVLMSKHIAAKVQGTIGDLELYNRLTQTQLESEMTAVYNLLDIIYDNLKNTSQYFDTEINRLKRIAKRRQ